MERGPARVTAVLVFLILLSLSFPFAATPSVRAMSGQWVITTTLQAGLSLGPASVTVTGSGTDTLNIISQNRITGTGSFQGSATVVVSSGCTGGGTIPITESVSYSGQVVNAATGNVTLTVGISGSSAPTSITMTCPNPNPPPATISTSVPLPSQMASIAGTYSILLVDGYTYIYKFPAPMTGSFTIRISGSAGTTTTSGTTSVVTGSLGLGVPFGKVQLCDSNGNNCVVAKGGETLQAGQCIITSQASGVGASNPNLGVVIGESTAFCLPAIGRGIPYPCVGAQIYDMIQGQVHVGTWGLQNGKNIYIGTTYLGVCDTGTEFTIRASSSGTTVMVLNDTVLATELASNSTVTMVMGQMITVQGSPSGMGQTAMMQAVKSFDPGSVNKWWLASGTATTSTTSGAPSTEIPTVAYVAVAAAVVIVIAALALSRTRSRRSA